MGWSHYASDGTARASSNVSASVDLPIGSITTYGGPAAPTGWLICDGSTISRAAFSELFAVIGTAYGVGDGSTTFSLPNLTGRVPVGKNAGTFATLGATGGAETHLLTANESGIREHTHQMILAVNGGSANSTDVAMRSIAAGIDAGFRTQGVASSSTYGSALGQQNASQAHNNLQPYQVVNYIIKAKNVAATTAADFQAARAKNLPTLTTSIASTSNFVKVSLDSGGGAAGVNGYDTDGFLDAVNNRFVVPAGLAGHYRLTGIIEWPGNATGFRAVGVSKNGVMLAKQAN